MKKLENLYKEEKESFDKSLMMGRFVINLENGKTYTLIMGDEGGLFLLINSVPKESIEEKIILDSGVTEEYLQEKRTQEDKIVIGKGAFGAVKFALSVFGDRNVDIGQLVCVKKSSKISEKKPLSKIIDSVFDDYLARKLEAIHTPKVLDMAIVTNPLVAEGHRKGYVFMEIVPQNTADKVFSDDRYQKWEEYQKSYAISVIETTKRLLENNGILNTDLKPENTLFDTASRKVAIIDLGSSLILENKDDIKKDDFDASNYGYGWTDLYCPPEMKPSKNVEEDKKREKVNLNKVISYLCGVTIAEVTSIIPLKQDNKSKRLYKDKDKNNWSLGERSDLKAEEQKMLKEILEGMINENPSERLDIDSALERLKKIGKDESRNLAIYKNYIEAVRKQILSNPSILSLNSNILAIREKGIVEQYTTGINPKLFQNLKVRKLREEFDDFLVTEKNSARKVMVLFGEAGSGKSLSLQLRFIDEVEKWDVTKPLPIFFNLANEFDLEEVIRKINNNLSCNLEFTELTKNKKTEGESVHLFIDSYDENSQVAERDIINEYLKNFSEGQVKILITCRTGFKEGDNLTRNPQRTAISYIAPIDYRGLRVSDNLETSVDIEGFFLEDPESAFKEEILNWLKRERREGRGLMKEEEINEKIIQLIRRLSLRENMGTGLMFDMIMKILTDYIELNVSDENRREGS